MKNLLIGFASILSYKDISHIIYLAVTENLRNKGYGSKIIQEIKKIKTSQKILADLEKNRHDERK